MIENEYSQFGSRFSQSQGTKQEASSNADIISVNTKSEKEDEIIKESKIENLTSIFNHLNTFESLFSHNEQQNNLHHGIVISGHRGGYLANQPENTLKAFSNAIE